MQKWYMMMVPDHTQACNSYKKAKTSIHDFWLLQCSMLVSFHDHVPQSYSSQYNDLFSSSISFKGREQDTKGGLVQKSYSSKHSHGQNLLSELCHVYTYIQTSTFISGFTFEAQCSASNSSIDNVLSFFENIVRKS